MFCPNCGKDCGDAKFCSECGQKLQNEETQKVQLVKEKPWNKNTQKGSTNIPTSGGYLGVGDSLVLSDSGVSICVKTIFNKFRTQISYAQLKTVVYSRPTSKPRAYGALLFRGGANENIPVPENRMLSADKAAITVPLEKDTLFYHIFHMLKAVAPASAQFKMITTNMDILELKGKEKEIDMDYFFEMYAPFREKAASAIRAKHEIPLDMARDLVNKDFDARQKKQYEMEPLDAIRDLNLIVEDMRRQERQASHADAERRKRLERESIITSLEKLK